MIGTYINRLNQYDTNGTSVMFYVTLLGNVDLFINPLPHQPITIPCWNKPFRWERLTPVGDSIQIVPWEVRGLLIRRWPVGLV